MNLYLPLEDYLAQWFLHENGGTEPVQLVRGSVEWGLLEQFLTTRPADYQPEVNHDGCVCIVIPNFRKKDTRDNYYLPPRATEALRACIRNRFDVAMWNSIHKFSNLFLRQDELIYAFMEQNGIDANEKNWNAIAKRYQRKRDLYKRIMRRKRKNQQK